MLGLEKRRIVMGQQKNNKCIDDHCTAYDNHMVEERSFISDGLTV